MTIRNITGPLCQSPWLQQSVQRHQALCHVSGLGVGPEVWGQRCVVRGVGSEVWGQRCGARGVGSEVWGQRCGARGVASGVAGKSQDEPPEANRKS